MIELATPPKPAEKTPPSQAYVRLYLPLRRQTASGLYDYAISISWTNRKSFAARYYRKQKVFTVNAVIAD